MAERDKFSARPMYTVTDLQDGHGTLQKFVKNQLSLRQYVVPVEHIFPVSSQCCYNGMVWYGMYDIPHNRTSDSDSDQEVKFSTRNMQPVADQLPPA